MYTIESLEKLLKIFAKDIDISDEMFALAVKEYTEMGKWIDKATPIYDISIYPQGSFALGTVVRPITDTDDYDLDLVCEFLERYDLTAKQLKVDTIKPLLLRYKKTARDIEEKRCCWHVEYSEVPNFHLDIIPSYKNKSYINITEHDEINDRYSYIGSNPAGYVRWFFEQCKSQQDKLYNAYLKEHKETIAEAEVEEIKRHKIKTPLQQAVQLLKRHRDIMFENMDSKNKPISIIITTLAGRLYTDEDNVFDALKTILYGMPLYIQKNIRNGDYFIDNPSYEGENFANKWNDHPERAEAFKQWVSKATCDLLNENLLKYNRVEMANHMTTIFGKNLSMKVFSEMAEESKNSIVSGATKIDPSTGRLSTSGTISIPTNHHHEE